jgi:hypothetical protein
LFSAFSAVAAPKAWRSKWSTQSLQARLQVTAKSASAVALGVSRRPRR